MKAPVAYDGYLILCRSIIWILFQKSREVVGVNEFVPNLSVELSLGKSQKSFYGRADKDNIVQVIGKKIVLYRESKEKKKIVLPVEKRKAKVEAKVEEQ